MPPSKYTKENGGDPSSKKNRDKKKIQNGQDSDAISGISTQNILPSDLQLVERVLGVLRAVARREELEAAENAYEEEIKREKELHDLRITIENLQDDRQKDREIYAKSNMELDILRQECEQTKDSLQAKREELELSKSTIEKQLLKKQEKGLEDERARVAKEKKREILELNEKLTKLQSRNKKLEEEKSKLSADLTKIKEDLANTTMTNDAYKDRIRNLQEEKDKQISEVAIMSHTPEFYIDRFSELAEEIQEVARIYFTYLPSDLEKYESTKKVLNEVQNSSEIFRYTPASSAPIPNFLRRCGVEHFISTTICKIIARPFIDGCAPEFNTSEKPLDMIRQQLLRSSSRSENIWRALTVKGTAPSLRLQSLRTTMVKDILGKLTGLISLQTRPELEKDLLSIVDSALDIWRALRSDSCGLELNFIPDLGDRSTWLSPGSPVLELSPSPEHEDSYDAQSATPPPPDIMSFALFPRVAIFPGGEGTSSNSDMMNANGHLVVGASNGKAAKETTTIYPGRALFSDSDTVKEGIRLQKRLETKYNQHMLAFPSQEITSPVRPQLDLQLPKQRKQGRRRAESSDLRLDN